MLEQGNQESFPLERNIILLHAHASSHVAGPAVPLNVPASFFRLPSFKTVAGEQVAQTGGRALRTGRGSTCIVVTDSSTDSESIEASGEQKLAAAGRR